MSPDAHAPPFRIRDGEVVLGGEPVLQGIDLDVPSGQFLALLGGNGSGKSTLLRVMLGLLPPSAGEVHIFGTPPAKFADWPRIAYVPQHLLASSAVPVSVSEVVAAGLFSPQHRWRRTNKDTIRRSLERVGLWQRRRDSFHHLSGGQQRRVMIASALAKNAEVLLLDEPTAGVDSENVANLERILSGLKGNGVTVVLVTHELGSLQHLMDRCIVLGHGDRSSVMYDGPAPPPSSLRDPHPHHGPDDLDRSAWEFGP